MGNIRADVGETSGCCDQDNSACSSFLLEATVKFFFWGSWSLIERKKNNNKRKGKKEKNKQKKREKNTCQDKYTRSA
jgi:hypothetical protein